MTELTNNDLAKILFVDDDASLANAFKRLHRDRYEIYLAESGADALELMTGNNDFSVIIADFNMPKMDGIRFLQRAREKSPDAITIMLTGNANLDLAIQALHKGEIYRFLTKPCAPEVLEKAIDNAIEKFGVANNLTITKTVDGFYLIDKSENSTHSASLSAPLRSPPYGRRGV